MIALFPAYFVDHFSWPRFLSIQLWLMVLFLVYVTVHELNELFGNGELFRLFFRWRSSEAKLTRRRRARLLIRLNRLTETSSVETISEPGRPNMLNWSASCGNSRRRPGANLERRGGDEDQRESGPSDRGRCG